MPTKADATALALAEAARQAQLQLRREMVSDVSRTWAVLDFDRLQKTWPAWLQMMLRVLRTYHSQSAEHAVLFYRATRQLELGEPGSAAAAAPPAEEWVGRALGYSAPGFYERQRRTGIAPAQANRAALTQTLGTSSRIVLDGGRTTITESAKADPEPVGFYRVTDGDPCAFCALMASRGAVYHTAGTAGEVDKWHNDCGCGVAPAFSKDVALPAISVEAQRVYRDRGNGDAMSAFRKAWSNRRAA